MKVCFVQHRTNSHSTSGLFGFQFLPYTYTIYLSFPTHNMHKIYGNNNCWNVHTIQVLSKSLQYIPLMSFSCMSLTCINHQHGRCDLYHMHVISINGTLTKFSVAFGFCIYIITVHKSSLASARQRFDAPTN